MKDKHPAKVKLARKLILPIEIKYKVPLFLSMAWQSRKAQRAQAVIERERLQKKGA